MLRKVQTRQPLDDENGDLCEKHFSTKSGDIQQLNITCGTLLNS